MHVPLSPDFLIDQNRFLQHLLYTVFTILDKMFLTAVRHKVNNLESSVVVQELELAINLAFKGFLWSLGNQYNVGTLF